MIEVPQEFRPHIRVDYPPNNDLIFEEWFYENYDQSVEDDREYLPIFFTSYWVNNNYGNDKRAKQKLQDYVNNLDPSRSYYVVCQYDDSVLIDMSHLDVKIFGMGGQPYDYPLPLIGKPHPYSYTAQRDIFCNFMGALTHQIRKNLLPVAKKAGYLVSTSSIPISAYCLNLQRSVFTLCPRGYGLTSFRLAEALQFGSIPVYISDKFMIPHNREFDYGVLIEPKDIPNIDRILKGISKEEIERKQSMIPIIYDELFTYEGCKNQILKHI